MPYCPNNDHRAKRIAPSDRVINFAKQMFQRFETPEVEAAFQTYQAQRAISVVFWIMLGGISVGVIFAIQAIYSNTLDIPIVSHLAWVVPSIVITFWLRLKPEQFILFTDKPYFFLILCLTRPSAPLSDAETFHIIKERCLPFSATWHFAYRTQTHACSQLPGHRWINSQPDSSQRPAAVLVQDITEVCVAALMGSVASWLIESDVGQGSQTHHDLTNKIAEVEGALSLSRRS